MFRSILEFGSIYLEPLPRLHVISDDIELVQKNNLFYLSIGKSNILQISYHIEWKMCI